MKDDNSRQFNQVKCRSGNVKNANVWMNQNYNASQEVSNILLTLGGPIIYELFWSLGHVRLTAIIYACIWTWHITIVYTAWSNKFWTVDHRSLTSTYSFFQSWFRITRDVLVTKFLDISASSFCFFSSLSPLFLARFWRGRNVCLPLFYEILNLVFTFMQILQNGFFPVVNFRIVFHTTFEMRFTKFEAKENDYFKKD